MRDVDAEFNALCVGVGLPSHVRDKFIILIHSLLAEQCEEVRKEERERVIDTFLQDAIDVAEHGDSAFVTVAHLEARTHELAQEGK